MAKRQQSIRWIRHSTISKIFSDFWEKTSDLSSFFKVVVLVLITPHSAGIKRVYSLVNKNKPAGSDRNRIDIDGTLTSILSMKFARPDVTTLFPVKSY